METRVKTEITAALNTWLARSEENTGAYLSKVTGVSSAYISQVKNGLYKVGQTEIKDEVLVQIARAIGYQFGEVILHWETENLKRIVNVCSAAQRMKRRYLVEGGSGLGKTYALEYYARQNDRVIYVKATSSMTPNDLLGEILLKLGNAQPPHGTRARLVKIRELAAKPGYLVILDEMEDVSVNIFKAAKEIADFCQGACGFVVAGIGLMEYFAKRAKQSRNTPFVQLKRRFGGNCLKVREVTKTEIRKIVKDAGFAEKTALAWWQSNIEDFDMLSQYLTDILTMSRTKAVDLGTVTASELEAFFSL